MAIFSIDIIYNTQCVNLCIITKNINPNVEKQQQSALILSVYYIKITTQLNIRLLLVYKFCITSSNKT